MEKIACWIDLAVPYCGDYPESNLWTEYDMRTYNGQLAQRMQLSQRESRD
jgi:hypothetical protein